MGRRLRLLAFLSGLSVLVLAAAIAKALQRDGPVDPDYSAIVNSRIVVQGVVIDDEGAPLSGVTMETEKQAYTNDLTEFSRRSRTEETISGAFEVECARCAHVILYFSKSGYYDARYTCSRGLPDGGASKEMICKDLEVVLEKMPPAVRMTTHRGDLLFDAQGVREVVPVGGNMRGPVRLDGEKTIESLRVSFVYLTARVGPDGTLSRRPDGASGSRWQSPPTPVGARLVFSNPADGAVLYQPRANRAVCDLVFREMREAPELGYQNQIDFDKLGAGTEDYYFYCKIGSLYGKGHVPAPGFRSINSPTEVGTHIEIRLNPDGSRNVTTHY